MEERTAYGKVTLTIKFNAFSMIADGCKESIKTGKWDFGESDSGGYIIDFSQNENAFDQARMIGKKLNFYNDVSIGRCELGKVELTKHN